MELSRGVLLIFVVMMLIIQYSSNVQGRYHYHKKKKNKESSPPPSPVPSSPVEDPPESSAPSDSPSIPSDPYPNATDSIFDVTEFGAVGDGCADDTAAFKATWKAACGVEAGTVLAPADKTFMITSTIFSGPCKPGLVFQVKIVFIFIF